MQKSILCLKNITDNAGTSGECSGRRDWKECICRRIQDRGKTATSQTLPRSANKYISSFVGFAPADDPQILGMCVIYNPQGVYYGGTIAAPVIGKIFENILPYLGIEKQ